jgi:hypothetical protein
LKLSSAVMRNNAEHSNLQHVDAAARAEIEDGSSSRTKRKRGSLPSAENISAKRATCSSVCFFLAAIQCVNLLLPLL